MELSLFLTSTTGACHGCTEGSIRSASSMTCTCLSIFLLSSPGTLHMEHVWLEVNHRCQYSGQEPSSSRLVVKTSLSFPRRTRSYFCCAAVRSGLLLSKLMDLANVDILVITDTREWENLLAQSSLLASPLLLMVVAYLRISAVIILHEHRTSTDPPKTRSAS